MVKRNYRVHVLADHNCMVDKRYAYSIKACTYNEL